MLDYETEALESTVSNPGNSVEPDYDLVWLKMNLFNALARIQTLVSVYVKGQRLLIHSAISCRIELDTLYIAVFLATIENFILD